MLSINFNSLENNMFVQKLLHGLFIEFLDPQTSCAKRVENFEMSNTSLSYCKDYMKELKLHRFAIQNFQNG